MSKIIFTYDESNVITQPNEKQDLKKDFSYYIILFCFYCVVFIILMFRPTIEFSSYSDKWY
jgi:hypothetical protein